jgi:hypothetical protein
MSEDMLARLDATTFEPAADGAVITV